MADIDFFDDFETIWGTTGGVWPVDEKDYRRGWAYIGDTPPAVEQFNQYQQLVDQRMAWLFRQLKELARVYTYPLGADRIDGVTQAFAKVRTYSPGDVVVTAGLVPPSGTLAMNGATYSTLTYPQLYAAIGNRYGGAASESTFKVPNVPDGYALVGGAGESVGATTVGAILAHIHEARVGAGGAHGHAGRAMAGGQHNHEYVYSPAASSPDAQGAADGRSYLDLTRHVSSLTSTAPPHEHALEIDAAADHTHPATIASTGGAANYAAGVKFLMCIAF